MNPKADARTRTGDPIITSDVLYQLSYVGEARILAACGLSALDPESRSRVESHV